MNIDKWDLFSICESLLLVSEKPVTVERVVEILLREQEEELERLADAEAQQERAEEKADETFGNAESLAHDPALQDLRSPWAQAQLDGGAMHADAALALVPAPGGEKADAVAATAEESEAKGVAAEARDGGVDAEEGKAGEVAATLALTPAEEATAEKKIINEDARRLALVKREMSKLVQDAFDALISSYADSKRPLGRGFAVVAVAGGYQLRTSAAVAPFVRHHLQVKPTKLSRAQLETLAIVAYRQPVTRPELEQIRGVDCGAAMKILLDKKLVRILGKKEEVGRPLLYGTSKEFLEFFRLGSLLELPTLREFQDLSDEHKRQVEEELEVEAPLGDLRALAESTPSFDHDDSALIQDLDTALGGAKKTVERVAELTGLKVQDEEPDTTNNA